MKRIVLTFLTALSLTLMPSLTVSSTIAYAAPTCTGGGAKEKVLEGLNNTTDDACNDNGIPNTIAAVTNILSILVGAIAIIAIISGGFKYITSGGDATKVTNAKHTIIYALVGIAVVVLAQLLVRIVITTTNNAAHGCNKPNEHYQSSTNSCVPD